MFYWKMGGVYCHGIKTDRKCHFIRDMYDNGSDTRHQYRCSYWPCVIISSQWRHNGLDGVSNHQPYDCLLNRLFRRRLQKTSKLRVTGLCEGNSPYKGPITRKMFPFDDVIMLRRFWNRRRRLQRDVRFWRRPLQNTCVFNMVRQFVRSVTPYYFCCYFKFVFSSLHHIRVRCSCFVKMWSEMPRHAHNDSWKYKYILQRLQYCH